MTQILRQPVERFAGRCDGFPTHLWHPPKVQAASIVGRTSDLSTWRKPREPHIFWLPARFAGCLLSRFLNTAWSSVFVIACSSRRRKLASPLLFAGCVTSAWNPGIILHVVIFGIAYGLTCPRVLMRNADFSSADGSRSLVDCDHSLRSLNERADDADHFRRSMLAAR